MITGVVEKMLNPISTNIGRTNQPLIAKKIQAGQFVIVRPNVLGERIPLSVCGWDKKEGTITIFSLDGDQGISEHTTPFDEMVQILDGKASIVISGEEYILEKGEMIIMLSKEPHALKAISPFKMMQTMISA